MPSAKISALTAATAPLGTDLHVLARGSSNRKLTTDLLFQETMTLAAFQAAAAGSTLIAGRWYRVTGTAAGTAYLLATSTSAYSPEGYLDYSGSFGLVVFGNGLSNTPTLYVDEFGQSIYCLGATGPNPWQTNSPYFVGNSVYSVTVNPLSYSAGILSALNSTIKGAVLAHPGLSLFNCELVAANIVNDGGGTALLINTTKLVNASINDDGQGGSIANCNFYNCNVNLVGGPNINGLTIYGGAGASYTIDAAVEPYVQNSWAGVVHYGEAFGSSTVRAIMGWSAGTTQQSTADADGAAVYFAENSPIGIYELADFDGTGSYNPGDAFGLNVFNGTLLHPVKLQVNQMSLGTEVDLVTVTNQSGAASTDLVAYHGITPKVHQLFVAPNYVEIMQKPNNDGSTCYFLKYGAHYD